MYHYSALLHALISISHSLVNGCCLNKSLNVFTKFPEKPAKITKPFKAQKVKESSSAEFMVTMDKPDQTVTWYQNGKEVSDARAEVSSADDKVTLTLNDTKVKDAADYKVVIENKRGKVQSECKLTVLCKCFTLLQFSLSSKHLIC